MGRRQRADSCVPLHEAAVFIRDQSYRSTPLAVVCAVRLSNLAQGSFTNSIGSQASSMPCLTIIINSLRVAITVDFIMLIESIALMLMYFRV